MLVARYLRSRANARGTGVGIVSGAATACGGPAAQSLRCGFDPEAIRTVPALTVPWYSGVGLVHRES